MVTLAPVIVIALCGVAYKVSRTSKRGVLSKERKDIFLAAMKSLKDPVKLRMLADTYQAEGLKVEADLLRKRANLRALPKEVQAARRAAFRKCMSSLDADGIDRVAAVYEEQGATGAAEDLRRYARGLRLVNPTDIEAMALMYEGKGYADTAAALRKRAAEVATPREDMPQAEKPAEGSTETTDQEPETPASTEETT
jgi:hypothetical protein